MNKIASGDFRDIFNPEHDEIEIIDIQPAPHPSAGSTFNLPEINVFCQYCNAEFLAVNVGKLPLLCPDCWTKRMGWQWVEGEGWQDV